MSAIKRSALRLGTSVLPERIQDYLVSRLSKPLRLQLCEKMTREVLTLLLDGMDFAFLVSGSYRQNIQDFRATYVFRIRNDGMAVSAVFENGDMKVEEQARPAYDTCVSFQDAHAFWSFILAENQDILDSILQNTVDVDGNLNYLYKFGFLAKDLTRRLGVMQLFRTPRFDFG